MNTTAVGAQLEPQFVAEWFPRYLEAWDRHDGERVAEMCTEDVIWSDPAKPEPMRGRSAAREFVQETVRAFPDFRVDVLSEPLVSTNRPQVFVEYEMSGTMRGDWEVLGFAATGRPIRTYGIDRYTFRDQLLAEVITTYDGLDVARQLGILPASGSSAERLIAGLQRLQARVQRRKVSS